MSFRLSNSVLTVGFAFMTWSNQTSAQNNTVSYKDWHLDHEGAAASWSGYINNTVPREVAKDRKSLIAEGASETIALDRAAKAALAIMLNSKPDDNFNAVQSYRNFKSHIIAMQLEPQIDQSAPGADFAILPEKTATQNMQDVIADLTGLAPGRVAHIWTQAGKHRIEASVLSDAEIVAADRRDQSKTDKLKSDPTSQLLASPVQAQIKPVRKLKSKKGNRYARNNI